MRFTRWFLASTIGLHIAGVTSALASDSIPALQAATELDLVFFASLDAGRTSGFGAAGGKVRLSGTTNDDGIFLLASAGSGFYRYRAGDSPGGRVVGRPSEASIMPGAQFVIGTAIVSAFVGAEVENQTTAPRDPDNAARGTRFGAKGQVDIYARPAEAILVTGSLIAGSAAPDVSARLSAGYRLWADVYIGPEVTGYRNATSSEAHFGLHATGLAIGRLVLRLSGGLSFTGDGHQGIYGSLGSYIRY